MEAWEETRKKSRKLLKSARRVGFANCRCGCENKWIKVGKIETYSVGKKTDPPMQKLSDEDANALLIAEKAQRSKRRKERRKKQSAGAKLARRLGRR